MVSFAKIAKSEAVKTVLEEAQKIIKTGKADKRAEDLLKTPKKKARVAGEERSVVSDGSTETVVAVDKKKLKIKKPDVSQADADDALYKYNASKITPKVLDDFNIKNMKSEKDILNLIQIVSKKYAGEIKDRTRGIQDHDQTRKLADILQNDPKKLTQTILRLKPGETINAEYMLAARELFAAGMGRLDDIAKKISTGNASDTVKLEWRQHFALMSEFQKILKGAQTETARTLQSFRIPTRTKNYSNVNLDDLNRSDLLVELGGGDEIASVAKMYLKAGSQQAKNSFTENAGNINNFQRASDSVAEIFINSILSNPFTHIKNTAGNWVAQSMMQFERKLAAKGFGGKEVGGVAEFEDIAKAYGRQMANQEMMVALMASIKKRGLKNVVKDFDTMVPANHGGSKVEMVGQKFTSSNFNMESGSAANTVDVIGRILTLDRIPTRMLGVADNYFKNGEYRSELYALAYREAMENINSGRLAQTDAGSFIASRVLNPTKQTVETAKSTMLESVFQTKMKDRGDALGGLGNVITQAKGSGGGYFGWLSNYYLPFTQTPVNVFGFVAERTPVMAQMLTKYSKDIAAGGARAQLARTKLRLGSMFYFGMSPLGYMGFAGGADINIPGSFSGGKSETMKGLGLQPNAIRMGGTQINLTGLDPINGMISQAANFGMYANQMVSILEQKKAFGGKAEFNGMDAQNLAQLQMGLVLSFGENLFNGTNLMGVGEAFKDVQTVSRVFAGEADGGKALKKWTSRFAGSFVPSGIKQGAKAIGAVDDYMKISTELTDVFSKTLYNHDLPNNYNMFGKKIQPFGLHSTTDDYGGKAEEEFKKIMPKVSPPRNTITYSTPLGSGTIAMTDKEQEFYKFNAGKFYKQAIEEELLTNPEYVNSDRVIKEAYLKKALSKSREFAMKELKENENYGPDIIIRQGEAIANDTLFKQKGEPVSQGLQQQLNILTGQE